VLDDDVLEQALSAHAAASESADRLVDLALDAGARDNVSVVVADVAVPRDPSVVWQPALTL
jgi:serine/threonine protein phosphatase PrpC